MMLDRQLRCNIRSGQDYKFCNISEFFVTYILISHNQI